LGFSTDGNQIFYYHRVGLGGFSAANRMYGSNRFPSGTRPSLSNVRYAFFSLGSNGNLTAPWYVERIVTRED
jgi:hypothetical protein